MIVPVTPEQLAETRRGLGQQLACLREAAGLTQAQLAKLTGYTRSTIANLETGRSSQPRTSWTRYDHLLNADGVLLAGYDHYAALTEQNRQHAAAERERRRTDKIEQWRRAMSTSPAPADHVVGPGLDPDRAAHTFSLDAESASLAGGDVVPQDPTMILEDGEVVATNRRRLLTGALGLSATLARGGSSEDGVPDHTGALLTQVTGAYRRLERAQPSYLLIRPVAGCVELARHIINATGPAGGRMYAVLSEVAGLAAWLCIDIQDLAGARRYYRIGIEAAERSGHRLLPLYMRASLGQFAAEAGDTGPGLSLVRGARHRLPGDAPSLAYSWLDAVEARVLAERCDLEALTVLRRAEQRLESAASDEPVWPWIFRFDRPKLAAYRAVVATRLGRTADAEIAFAEAAATAPAPKQDALLQVERATALWAAGEAEASCALAAAALDTAGALESERLRQRVRLLRGRMGDRAGRATDELDARMAALYRERA